MCSVLCRISRRRGTIRIRPREDLIRPTGLFAVRDIDEVGMLTEESSGDRVYATSSCVYAHTGGRQISATKHMPYTRAHVLRCEIVATADFGGT